jgi:uncharacterized protein
MNPSPHHGGTQPGADIEKLQSLLDALPAPLEPLDPMAVDGFLCGIILQPQELPPARWLPFVADIDGRAPPPGAALAGLHTEVLHRHAELVHAIDARQWFDPWVFELDEDASPSLTVLPWVAGFAAAMDHFPALMASDDPALIEPLALLYRHFDPEDLEDADALLEVIDTLEPPADLAEAVEDLVRSTLLIADVTRPRRSAQRPGSARRRPGR